MKINWEKVANHFADHDEAVDRQRASMVTNYRLQTEDMERLAKDIVRGLPDIIEEYLKKCRGEGKPAGEWVCIWRWVTPVATEINQGLGVSTILECLLGPEKIRTKKESGGDGTYTGWELYANLHDIRGKAIENVNRPRVELGRSAKK
jgi:hypothetical protein